MHPSNGAPNGRLKWQYIFEWVIVPMTGLGLAITGALSGWISTPWIPVIIGLITLPFARSLDRVRRDK